MDAAAFNDLNAFELKSLIPSCDVTLPWLKTWLLNLKSDFPGFNFLFYDKKSSCRCFNFSGLRLKLMFYGSKVWCFCFKVWCYCFNFSCCRLKLLFYDSKVWCFCFKVLCYSFNFWCYGVKFTFYDSKVWLCSLKVLCYGFNFCSADPKVWCWSYITRLSLFKTSFWIQLTRWCGGIITSWNGNITFSNWKT